MWNIWQRRAKLLKSYPVGAKVFLAQFGDEFPVVSHKIFRDKSAYIVLDVRGYQYAQPVNV